MAGRLMLNSIRWNYQANNLAPIAKVGIMSARISVDVLNGGAGSIRGIAPGLTTFDSVPGPAKVYVLERKTMHIVRATRSAPDGTYALTNLRTDKPYLVLAVDENDQDNAVVMDRVQAGTT